MPAIFTQNSDLNESAMEHQGETIARKAYMT